MTTTLILALWISSLIDHYVYVWFCHYLLIVMGWWLYAYVPIFFFMFAAGLGFITSLVFIFFIGIFASSWMGSTVFWLGEWFIKRMPFINNIYSASKQISAAISPGKCFTVIFSLNWHCLLYHPKTLVKLECRRCQQECSSVNYLASYTLYSCSYPINFF